MKKDFAGETKIEGRIVRAFVAIIAMFCLFLCGASFSLSERIEALEIKIDEDAVACKELKDEISKQQEIERRILEQNIVLSSKIFE